VVACNQNGDNQAGLNFPGLTVILGPSGRIVKKDTGGKENMVIADLKAEALAEVRGHRMRYFLPNRRPDLY
jgi:N-carbamoylputrescine amidase